MEIDKRSSNRFLMQEPKNKTNLVIAWKLINAHELWRGWENQL